MAGEAKSSDLRLIVVGKTGVGKSASGNTILGKEEFTSDVSFKGVTDECQSRNGLFKGRNVVVVDTPGYFDPDRDNKKTSRIISDFAPALSPGLHAIVLVLTLSRFTTEEKKTFDEIRKIFKVRAQNYTILLFTRKEELRGRSLHSALGTAPKDLKELAHFCGNRYLAFNNHATGAEREAQVAELIALVDKMGEFNISAPLYTPEMFKEDSSQIDCCTIL